MDNKLDKIREIANKFMKTHGKEYYARILPDLRKTLLTLEFPKDKKTFLNYIKLDSKYDLEQHLLDCSRKPCGTQESFDDLVFFIDQEISIIDKFEEKERNNFLHQFDNNTIITGLISIILPLLGVSFYLGTQQEKTESLEKELLILRETSANEKTYKEIKDSTTNNNSKDSTNNFRRDKHNKK